MKKKNGYPKRKRKFECLILPLLKTMKNYAVKCVSGRVSFKGGQGVSFKGGQGVSFKGGQGVSSANAHVSSKQETATRSGYYNW